MPRAHAPDAPANPTRPPSDSFRWPPATEERKKSNSGSRASLAWSGAWLRSTESTAGSNKKDAANAASFLFSFSSSVIHCSCPPSPGNDRRRDGYRWRDRPRHGCRGRAPRDGFTACPAICTRPAKPSATQSRFGFGFGFGFGSCFQLQPAAGGPPRVSAAPPHPTRSGSSRRCRRCRSSRSGSSPGTAGDSPRRSSTPVPGTRSRW